jgi:hypothetical protein
VLYFNTAVDMNLVSKLNDQLRNQKVPMKFMPTSEPSDTDVSLAVDWLSNEVLFSAKIQSMVAEWKASFWRYASILLYLGGFILALGGKFFGVEVLKAGD